MDTLASMPPEDNADTTKASPKMFQFPKLIYKFQNRGDGRDLHNLCYDNKAITVCAILSLAWFGLILAYGMGVIATIGSKNIPFFVYTSLAMIIIFPVSLIWGSFFVYHYTHQSYKASNAILEAARILGSPALIAADDVKTLSSAVANQLNILRSTMRDIEDSLNGLSKRIDSEIGTLNESSDTLNHTLSNVSSIIRAERDAITDLMQIIKKENNNARNLIAENNQTHIEVSDIPQDNTKTDRDSGVIFDKPYEIGELSGGEITYSDDLRNPVTVNKINVSSSATTNALIPAKNIHNTENIHHTVQPIPQNVNNFETSHYTQKPEAIILRRERQLYEGVCALTVDLNRELGITLPQDLWSRYMRGERHVFAEHLFTKLDTHFSAYQNILDTEPLRKLCNQFIARFETLRERLFDEPDIAVSEYLENSGVGKIYNILSIEYV